MNLKTLSDNNLLLRTKELVATERQHLTQVLLHLREVERRKLFSDLRYASLFEYTVKELKYSEGQAGRRIQAMRLINELPEIEAKIESGELNLTHVSMAQSFFRASDKASECKMKASEKIEILERFENKTSREAEKILVQLQPTFALPKESERVIDDVHTEVKFVIDAELRQEIEELKALLGVKAIGLSFSELIKYMARTSVHDLRVKKFGKKITEQNYYVTEQPTPPPASQATDRATQLSMINI